MILLQCQFQGCDDSFVHVWRKTDLAITTNQHYEIRLLYEANDTL
jgi:hypothetical protein